MVVLIVVLAVVDNLAKCRRLDVVVLAEVVVVADTEVDVVDVLDSMTPMKVL